MKRVGSDKKRIWWHGNAEMKS
jgi:hypothetical protein